MKNLEKLKAKNVMTSPLLSVEKDTPLREAAQMLSDQEISGAIVKDYTGEAVGVVSLFDIVTYLAGLDRPAEEPGGFYRSSYPKFREGGEGWEDEWEEVELSSLNEVPVEEIMSTEILSVNEDTPISDVVQLLADRHIHRVFVSREGKPVGIISTMDVMKKLAGIRRSSTVAGGA